MRRLALVAIALGAGVLHAPDSGAHETVRPEPLHVEQGVWPGQPSSHDVLVPVVLVVAADGTVEHAAVEASVNPAFDKAALDAARRWRFKPASIDGAPVAAKVRVAIRFVGSPPAEAQAPASETALAATEAAGPHSHATDDPIEVLVTGEPAPRSAGEARLTRELLQAAPARSGSDLLRRAPGMFVTQHSGDGKAHQLFFRGFDAVHGQDLEVSVAGVPVNEVSHVHGQGYADLHFVIPELVERIDVLPGALRPEQGDFAVAGSVRYHLGLADPGATLKAGLGTYGARRLFMGYRPEQAHSQTFAALDLYQSDGFGTGRASERASAMAQIRHAAAEGLELRLMVSSYAGRFD